MPSLLLTAPAAEPLTLAEAKSFLRVEHNDDDAVIASLITAARLHVESETRRALITQSWRMVRDAWPDNGWIAVTPTPLHSLIAARVYDAEGTAHALDLQHFVLDLAASALAFAPWSLAAPGRAKAGIELDLSVGFGAAGSDVPEPLRQAIRMLVAHWYENRGVTGQSAPLPVSVASLIAPYRTVSL